MSRPKILPDTIEKICKICNKKFIVSYYLRSKRTYCSKSCANHDPDVISKMIISQNKTYNEKYGMHPMQTDTTKNELRKSLKEKYGVDWYSKSDEWNDKVEKTGLEKYGVKYYNNIEQIKKTCLEKYGIGNYASTEEYKEKYKSTCLKKYGVPHASTGKKFKIEHNKNMFDKFLMHPRFVNFSPEFKFDEYFGVASQNYKFKCKRCGTIKSYSIDDGKYPLCPSCDKNNLSTFQNEIYEYIKSILDPSINVELNDRTIIKPKELDIVIPALKIAIECDGVLWHSEFFGHKNKIYHIQKTNNCMISGYNLIHIFENEWTNKKDIIKSILLSIIGKNLNCIYGRKCHVQKISSRECVDFLNKNHLQGTDHSSIKLGLFNEYDELVSVMTFLKSRFDNKIQYEMGRFCNKIGTQVIGGASKLFSFFLKNYTPTSIVSYSDRRYFSGQVYLNLGFNFMGNTSPNYFYITDNYQNIQNRMCWQKHKLKNKLSNFNPTLTEWENMKNNGYDRIWDCGNGKWIWTIH